jgi:hypothetical protein
MFNSLTPENVRKVACEYAGLHLENLALGGRIPDRCGEDVVKDELLRSFKFHRTAAEDGRTVAGTFSI